MLKFAAKVVVGGVCLSLVLLNLQPWLEVGASLSTQIRIIPFLGLLVEIPWVGGWFLLASKALAQILAVLLWAFVQMIQVVPLLHQMQYLRLRPALLERAESLRWVAYCVEVAVCFLRFPPYQGGVEAFVLDAPHWQLYLIDWWQFALLIVAIAAFEAIVLIGAFMFAAIGSSGRKPAPSN